MAGKNRYVTPELTLSPPRTLRANERSFLNDYLGGTAEALFRPIDGWKSFFILTGVEKHGRFKRSKAGQV